MLSVFFLANTIVTAVLVASIPVTDPISRTIPWIFFGAFAATCVPELRNRMTTGSALWRLLPVLLYAGVIALASSVRGSNLGGVNTNLLHPVEFAALAFVAQLAANGGLSVTPRPIRVLLVAFGTSAYGVLDELHQSFVPQRTATVQDVLLDALGAWLGTLLFLSLWWAISRRHGASSGAN